MRVLFAYPFCGLGGVETSILTKLDALTAAGIDARAVFGGFYGSRSWTLAADDRIVIGARAAAIGSMLRPGDALVIVDHPEVAALLHEVPRTGPVVVETHASYPPAFPRLHRDLNSGRVGAVVVPSHFNKRIVEGALRSVRPVVVIPNPVDPSRFRPGHARALPDVELPPGGPVILWVGRMEDEKNPLELVAIGTGLLEARRDVRILMLGDTSSDDEYMVYRDRLLGAIPSQWAARFVFCRGVPYAEMPSVYALAAESGGCLVSTSRFESAPMTFIEAMSCGCPVVSSQVGGVGELVRDGDTGRLYEATDVAGAIRAIAGFFDATARAAIVARAHASVVRRHAPAACAQQYIALLDSLAPEAPAPQRPAVEPNPAPVDDPPPVVPGLVSTIIPVYNRPGMLEEAVASVLAQTYRNIEILIVDDGSTDDTWEVCLRLAQQHSEVRAYRIPHQGRAGPVREAGRLRARGEYLQYLDSDDLLGPTKFEQMVNVFSKDHDCDVAYCRTRRYRVGNAPTDLAAARTCEAVSALLPDIVARRVWFTSTPMYRRRISDRLGAWSDLAFWEDIEYDVRLATLAPRLCHCDDWLTDVRDHDTGRLSGSRFLDDPALLREAVRGSQLIAGHLQRVGFSYRDRPFRMFVDDVRVLYDRCQTLGLTPEADRCRAIVADAARFGPAVDPELGRVAARIVPGDSLLRAAPGESVCCYVEISNLSAVAFHGGEFATEVAYHLLGADGATLCFDSPTRTVLDDPLEPGESRVVDLWIQAPTQCGLYYAHIDLFWAGCRWLGATDGPAAYVKCLVTERAVEPHWRIHLEAPNEAQLERRPRDADAVRLAIRRSDTHTPWHIQLNHEPVSVVEGREHTVQFQARADRPRALTVAVSQAHAPWDGLGLYEEVSLTEDWREYALALTSRATDSDARIHFDAGGSEVSFEIRRLAIDRVGRRTSREPPFSRPGRLRMDIGITPASYAWGTDRGLPVHRYYVEQFLAEFAADVKGRCVEFQDPLYVPRHGGSAVDSLDILHIDGSNPLATLVADLTAPNDLPTGAFDCIVCSHVLHVIADLHRAVTELFRILKPGGVLLVAAPCVSMYGEDYGELWRFTPKGLSVLLSGPFRLADVTIRAYGNSLTAAGELRGVVADEFLPAELDGHDERFPVEVCARAVKRH